MNFCIIGTINRDHTIFADGTESFGFGGIFYSVLMLRYVINNSDKIIPICNTGEDIYDDVLLKFSALGKIETHYIQKIAQKNPTVKLVYRDQENRDEFICHVPPPLELSQLLAPDAVDAYLVNFITGKEMTLETFTQFCHQINVPIFMDFHSLSLGIAPDGKRFYLYPEFWREWIAHAEVLQMNEKEAANILQKDSPDEKILKDFAASLINNKLRAVNITLGSKGSILSYAKDKKILTKKFPAYPIDTVVDVTGSGDAFMAGFISHYMKTRNAEQAAKFANKVAGLKCSKLGAEGIKEIASNAI